MFVAGRHQSRDKVRKWVYPGARAGSRAVNYCLAAETPLSAKLTSPLSGAKTYYDKLNKQFSSPERAWWRRQPSEGFYTVLDSSISSPRAHAARATHQIILNYREKSQKTEQVKASLLPSNGLSAASESMQRDAFRSRKTVSGVAMR